MATTPSFTHACGALGRYDRDRLAAIVAAAEPGMRIVHEDEPKLRIVHEDERSALALDREPIRWRGRRNHGLAWSEAPGEPSAGAIRSWEEMATAGAGCGLVVKGRDRYLHSSVSGIAPIYYLAEDGAVYFSTRIDPLARSSPCKLTVDWEAWSAILTVDYPIGDRTPFVEIRRLAPYSLLRCRRGSAEASEQRWPWAEVEPQLEVADGARAVLERLRDSIARIPAGPVACQLSGGLDSRLCLGLLSERRRSDVRTITVDHDAGTDRELRVAARLAEMIGVPHEQVAGRPEDFWPHLVLRTHRVDYQFVASPSRMPLLAALRQIPLTGIDGFGFDVVAGPGGRYFLPDALDRSGRADVVHALWARIREKQRRRLPTLQGDLLRQMWGEARRQLFDQSKRFAGHPARAVLTFYLSRQVRGIASVPHAILGADVPIAMPLIDDRVARSALSISYQSKDGARLYLALFRILDPRLAELPSTSHGRDLPGEPLPRRTQSAEAAEPVLQAAEGSPLSPYLRPAAIRKLSRHRRGHAARTPESTLGPAIFGLWHERYRAILGEVDPGKAFGLPPRLANRELALEERVT